MGTSVAQWLRCCVTNRKVAGSIPAGVNGFFIDIKSFRSHYGPGVDSVSNRNEYEKHFLGGKGGRCVRLTTLPPSCAVVTKSGNLNFLEPSGPVQACNGTALPLLQCGSVCNQRTAELQVQYMQLGYFTGPFVLSVCCLYVVLVRQCFVYLWSNLATVGEMVFQNGFAPKPF